MDEQNNGQSEETIQNENEEISVIEKLNTLTVDSKLKGDAIGSTFYSERFILTTLLKLKDGEFDEELENDMCSVWDMTTEKEVVDYLLHNNFIDLSSEIIKHTESNMRLIEILIGIIGNMCIYEDAVLRCLKTADIEIILSQIHSTSDTAILIQILRLYKALMFHKHISQDLLLISNVKIETVNFILKSSRNVELLIYAMQVSAEIVCLIKDEFLKHNFLECANEACKEATANIRNDCVCEQTVKFITAYFKLLENMCTVINDMLDTNKLTTETIHKNMDQSCIKDALCNIEITLALCSDLGFILGQTNAFEYFIYCSANFIVTLRTPFNKYILMHYSNIIKTIVQNNLTFDTDVGEAIFNYLMYTFLTSEITQLEEAYAGWTANNIKIVLIDYIIQKYKCEDKFVRITEYLLHNAA